MSEPSGEKVSLEDLLLTAKQVAALTGCEVRTVHVHRANGVLSSVEVGEGWRFRVRDAVAFSKWWGDNNRAKFRTHLSQKYVRMEQ